MGDDARIFEIDALIPSGHPLLPQAEFREYSAEHDITIVAYRSLGNEAIRDVLECQAITDNHEVSVAQVSTAWLC